MLHTCGQSVVSTWSPLLTLLPLQRKRGSMSSLERIIQQIIDSDKAAELTWTYRDVCTQLLGILKEIVAAGDTPEAARGAWNRLLYCLRLARATQERDASLIDVIASMEYLLTRIDKYGDLTADAVHGAVEVVILDIEFFVSQHQ